MFIIMLGVEFGYEMYASGRGCGRTMVRENAALFATVAEAVLVANTFGCVTAIARF